MSFTDIYKTLTPQESTLYTKCKAGQRLGTWGSSLVSSLEHHGEQDTFKSLLEKLRNASPMKGMSNRQLWIASQLKTSIQELAKFEKKYPSYQPCQTPDFQFERIASLEARVAHLEHQLNRVYEIERNVQDMQDRTTRKRHSPRPHSPEYSPFNLSTPHYQNSNSHW